MTIITSPARPITRPSENFRSSGNRHFDDPPTTLPTSPQRSGVDELEHPARSHAEPIGR
jgi:hypothetical protein